MVFLFSLNCTDVAVMCAWRRETECDTVERMRLVNMLRAMFEADFGVL